MSAIAVPDAVVVAGPEALYCDCWRVKSLDIVEEEVESMWKE
jgi:hypothetical protein